MSRWEFAVEQDGMVVASGETPSEAEAKREAGHYAMMYSQDGLVKVSIKEVWGTHTLPRGGKAQDEVARINAIPVPTKLESVKELFKHLAGEREDWKNSMALSDAWEAAMVDKEFAVFCHAAGVNLNRNILVRWGLSAHLPDDFGKLTRKFFSPSVFEGFGSITKEDLCGFRAEDIAEIKIAEASVGKTERAEYGAREAGGAAGEDRRTVEAVSKGDDGVESGSVGIGEQKGVDI